MIGEHETFIRCEFEDKAMCKEAFEQALLNGWKVAKPSETVLLVFGMKHDS